jgi:hypothetical protein
MTNRLITQGFMGDAGEVIRGGFICLPIVPDSAYGLLGKILANMEQRSDIQTVSDHVCEPGMDIITSPFQEILKALGDRDWSGLFDPDIFDPDIFDCYE